MVRERRTAGWVRLLKHAEATGIGQPDEVGCPASGGAGHMVVRRHLLLPEGYAAKQAGAFWCLTDPHGAELLRSADASEVEVQAWRHLWRKRHEDFNDELAAFRSGALLPDLAGRHESPGT